MKIIMGSKKLSMVQVIIFSFPNSVWERFLQELRNLGFLTSSHTILSFILIIVFASTKISSAQVDESQVYKKYSTGKFFEILKPFQSSEFSVGIQSKGRVANVLTDYGQLSQFHVYAPSLNWPAFGDGSKDEQHYGWGIDLMMGYQGDVIESFQDPASNIITRDWQRANENLFSGNVTVGENDLTPIMATSDNRNTWPLSDTNHPFWPGIWRKDSEEVIYEGEFTSERDLFTVFTDEGNHTQYGLRVEQTAYSFTRGYAEDFVIFRFNIENTSTKNLENLYPGMMVQFLIDFDNHDLINFVDTNDDGKKDFIYMWDTNQLPQEPWIMVGYIGLLLVRSPNDIGVTNFHFFHDDFIPGKDEDFWRLLTSDTTGIPETIKARYFHGDNIHIDDVSYAPRLDPEEMNRGGEIAWSFSTGPVSLAPADSMPLEIAIVFGETEAELFNNIQWVWDLFNANWNGPNPPISPNVEAYPSDGKVTLVWDVSSEDSKDNVTGEKDFEGYKIYRSDDRGNSWGKVITDAHGKFISYVPLAQFDLKNDVFGYDPISGQYLGDNSGIGHTFIDTTVANGVEYWYSVTAYDRGIPDEIKSLESALGLSIDEINLVSTIPTPPANNLQPGTVIGETVLKPDSGITNGEVFLEIIDLSKLKMRNYKITFQEDSPVIEGTDTINYVTTFSLRDADSGEYLFRGHPLTDESGDNIPVVDGFRLSLENTEPGVSFIGWTEVSGDTSTFAWYTEKRTGSDQEVDEEIVGFDDFKIVVVDTSDGSIVALTDGVFGHIFHSFIKIPIKVFMITSPDNPIEVSTLTEVFDLKVQFPTSALLGPLGWDLIPGGAGYNPNLIDGKNTWWPDILALNSDSSGTSHVWLKTQNGPETTLAPTIGDEFTITVNKPFNERVVYTFSTTANNYTDVDGSDIKRVRVVPNPYFVTSAFQDQIMFINLPNSCEIKIFNIAGDFIRTINHKNDDGLTYWDLKNDEGLAVAYGLYVYVVKAENGEKYIGKMSIVR